MQAVLKNDVLIWINGAEYGHWTSHRYTFVPIPDQDVSSLFEWVGEPIEGQWKFIGTNDDIVWEFPVGDLPVSEHIGKLIAVNPSLAKPATIRRRFMGKDYDINCLVTQNIVNMWTSNPKQLNIDDFVLVSFIEEIPNTTERQVAIVTDKVYQSW